MRSLSISIFACVISWTAAAQEINALDSITKKTIDSTYTSLLEKQKVTGLSLAIVDNGKIVYAKGYGFEDLEHQIPASSKTIYRIGSVTKSFTAISIMQLQNEGKLSVNDELKLHLPEFNIGFQKNEPHPIVLGQMLSHTAGLPSDVMNGFFTENPESMEWYFEQVNQMKASFKNGYTHSYSNLGYGMLGEVIARKSGMSYDDYVNQSIFTPLNMYASFVHPTGNQTTPFSYVDEEVIVEPLITDVAAGLIHSNVEDMSNYLMMFLNRGTFNGKTILDSLSILEMEKKQTSDLVLKEEANFGYGLYAGEYTYKVDEDSSTVNVIGHGGDTFTFHADMKYIPELGIGVVVLTNSSEGNRINSGERLLRTYLKATQKASLKATPKPLPSSPKNDFEAGKYSIMSGIAEIQNEDKFKFKQGPIKVVAKKQEDASYAMKIMLLGFIPIKLKDQAICFEKLEGIVYLKARNTKTNDEQFIGKKLENTVVSDSWKAAEGKYTVQNAVPCDECAKLDLIFANLTLDVSEKDGLMLLSLGGKNVGIEQDYYAFNDSEKVLISTGVGRGCGETFVLREDGTIFYSGFVFRRK